MREFLFARKDNWKHVMKTFRLSLLVLLGFAAPAMANIVQNGSLENGNGTFINQTCNYMALGNGSTTIPGWTVSTSSGQIVWAQSPTCDGFSAADGSFFVDLSGFGSSSPDGALNQSLSTVGGVTYTFSMDIGPNNGTIAVSVGGKAVTLTGGTAFSVGSTSWTPETGTFVGDPLNTTPLLTIKDASPGSTIDFVDNISITGAQGNPTPEPATLALCAMGLAGLAARLRTRARRS